MEQENKTCPKCGGVMEKGEIFTATKGMGLLALGLPPVLRWTKSAAKLGFKGERVNTFACTQCGFLESYLEPKK